MTTALTVPDAQRSPLPAIRTQCRAIYDQRDEVIGVWSVEEADEARRRAGALERYVRDRESREEVQRSARILECAVGAALGPAQVGANQYEALGAPKGSDKMTAWDRHVCRRLYEHQDKWLPVLETRGLSQGAVLRLIRDRLPQDVTMLDTDRPVPILYVDPPWRYEHVKTDNRAIENRYPTMSLAEICALPVNETATDDAVLFLWATSPKLCEAMQVLEAWAFTYRTCAVWAKDQIGMGYYFRQQHEMLLVATKGNPSVPEPGNRPASVVSAPRGLHSAKPAVFYELIERMYPDFEKRELFQRGVTREGWVAGWGNQAVG